MDWSQEFVQEEFAHDSVLFNPDDYDWARSWPDWSSSPLHIVPTTLANLESDNQVLPTQRPIIPAMNIEFDVQDSAWYNLFTDQETTGLASLQAPIGQEVGIPKDASISTADLPTNPKNYNLALQKHKHGRVSRFSSKQAAPMQEWLLANANDPYPSNSQYEILAQTTGLSIQQVRNWFRRMRQRMQNSQAVRAVETGTGANSMTSLKPLVENRDGIKGTNYHSPRPDTPMNVSSCPSAISIPQHSLDVEPASPQPSLPRSHISYASWDIAHENTTMLTEEALQASCITDHQSVMEWSFTVPEQVDDLKVTDSQHTYCSITNCVGCSFRSVYTPTVDHKSDIVERQAETETDWYNIHQGLRVSISSGNPPEDSSFNYPDDNASMTYSYHAGSEGSMNSLDSFKSSGSRASLFGRRKGRKIITDPTPKKLEPGYGPGKLKYRCTICAQHQGFDAVWKWRRHEETQHSVTEVWICRPYYINNYRFCPICSNYDAQWSPTCPHAINNCWEKPVDSRSFTLKYGLIQHWKGVHCATKEDLKKSRVDRCWEILASDNLDLELECPYCGVTSQGWPARLDHIALHYKSGVWDNTVDEIEHKYSEVKKRIRRAFQWAAHGRSK